MTNHARLKRSEGQIYEARFRVRTNGLTLRALVPAASGRPCYLPTTTRTFSP